MLSVCYKGIAIPIYWKALKNQGNSHTIDRIEILERFLVGFSRSRIISLLADREFIGEDWFRYLVMNNIPFDIRLKKNMISNTLQGKPLDIEALCWHLKRGEYEVFDTKRNVLGQSLFLSAMKLSNGELLIIASTHKPENAFDRYEHRWEIETLFSCLKKRGFNFEETRLLKQERIESMLSILTIAFAWCHKIGDWKHENEKPIKRKKHGRLSVSYFRYGLDSITRAILDNQIGKKKYNLVMSKLIRLISQFIKGYPNINDVILN